jgi:hypothetical protein
VALATLDAVRLLPSAEAVVELVPSGTDLAVSMANGEPVALVDALEGAAADGRRDGLRVHQMHPLAERPSITGGLG